MGEQEQVGARAVGTRLSSSTEPASSLGASRFDPSRLWHDVRQVPYSTIGYGGGTMLLDDGGACIGYVVVLNKDASADPKALDAAVHRAIKDRTVAIRWANQSVEMLQDAFFPVADALRDLERYLKNTPHHNAVEAAAARKALRAFDAARDSDRDPEGDETQSGSVGEADRARAEGIAPNKSGAPPHE